MSDNDTSSLSLDRSIFTIEDTSDNCYRDIIQALKSRGWRTNSTTMKRMSKFEKKRLAILKGELPSFIWTIHEKDIQFNELLPHQIVNHFEGITCLTTKNGLCELLRDMSWINIDSTDISPRCYNLGDPVQKVEFAEDFRISAAVNILLQFTLPDHESSFSDVSTNRIASLCCCALSQYLHVKYGGMIGSGFSDSDDRKVDKICNMSVSQWDEILAVSYELSETDIDNKVIGEHLNSLLDTKELKVTPYSALKAWAIYLLHKYAISHRQLFMGGHKNIWVVKAPEASKGANIKLFFRLGDILDCERGMRGRTVQKYVERPFLYRAITPGNALESSTPYYMEYRTSPHVKFDLRVWVLVTGFPADGELSAYVYNKVYGRRCPYPYKYNVDTIGDVNIHVTNYSVQKQGKSSGPECGQDVSRRYASECISPRSQSAAAGRLRSTVQSVRNKTVPLASGGDAKTPHATSNMTGNDLLVSHEQLLELLDWVSKNENRRREWPTSGELLWSEHIWPRLTSKIMHLLTKTRESVQHRNNSFEFLGFDIMLDENLEPWILEVNMSPAMAHRNPQHNEFIRCMADRLVSTVFRDGIDTVEYPPVTCDRQAGDEPADAKFLPCRSIYKGNWEKLYSCDGIGNESRNEESSFKSERVLVTGMGILRKDEPLLMEYFGYCQKEVVATANRASDIITAEHGTVRVSSRPECLSRRSNDLSKPTSGLRTSTGVVAARPKSASSLRKSSYNYTMNQSCKPLGVQPSNPSNSMQFVSHLDFTFAAVGKSISKAEIKFLDSCNEKFACILLLQRWWRRYIIRTHLYYAREKYCARIVQCAWRCYCSKTNLWLLRRQKAAILVQCCWRQKSARLYRAFLIRTNAAVAIQAVARCLLARRYCTRIRRHNAAQFIQFWVRDIWRAWKLRACRKICRLMRRTCYKWRFHRRYTRQKLRALAQMAAEVGAKWTALAEERARKEEEEKRIQLQKEAERVAKEEARKYEEECERETLRDARGYGRMDRLYSLWKSVVLDGDNSAPVSPLQDAASSEQLDHRHSQGHPMISTSTVQDAEPAGFSLEQFVSKYESVSAEVTKKAHDSNFFRMLSDKSVLPTHLLEDEVVDKARHENESCRKKKLAHPVDCNTEETEKVKSNYISKGKIYYSEWMFEDVDGTVAQSKQKRRSGRKSTKHCSKCESHTCKCKASKDLSVTMDKKTIKKSANTSDTDPSIKRPVVTERDTATPEVPPDVMKPLSEIYENYDTELKLFLTKIKERKLEKERKKRKPRPKSASGGRVGPSNFDYSSRPKPRRSEQSTSGKMLDISNQPFIVDPKTGANIYTSDAECYVKWLEDTKHMHIEQKNPTRVEEDRQSYFESHLPRRMHMPQNTHMVDIHPGREDISNFSLPATDTGRSNQKDIEISQKCYDITEGGNVKDVEDEGSWLEGWNAAEESDAISGDIPRKAEYGSGTWRDIVDAYEEATYDQDVYEAAMYDFHDMCMYGNAQSTARHMSWMPSNKPRKSSTSGGKSISLNGKKSSSSKRKSANLRPSSARYSRPSKILI